ncbi:methyltransferase domain-containing protein [Actinopolymorpha pittospori]|uniref:Ubiquinone/menaquinone biosynthesis C-methylase UbiE n=1 Tax=Actinopolymorpha pittospori TaxID=648752 RepID=A0A927MW24_9ACTN|nr:ubiquinone/menaquinone biosynthesis C-methylase UbiE [Actinopolymorpha pittospori]
MISQHPLGYLLGLQGIAMLRAFAGDYDREFVEARLTEIQALLDARPELGEGATLAPITTVDGYREWAQFYDEAANQLIELEQPVVREILDGLAPGRALYAACGTGRHASYLASSGHEVIGVDSSPEMLAKARAKIPEGTFVLADLLDLPLPDDHVDLVVCALALTHVPDLEPVLAEFARVLRPGGHLVISDSRGLLGDLGLPLIKTIDGGFGYLPTWSRHTSDYLRVALPLGLQVRRCEEPRRPYPLVDATDAYTPVPGTPPNIWALHSWCVDATNAAYRGVPVAVIWDFQLSAS